MADAVTYESFLSLLESMVRNRESGALYLRTDTNHSVCIGINQGQIEALVAGPRRGLAAINTILSMSAGTCRRDETPIAFHSGDLPQTGEILRMLTERHKATGVSGATDEDQDTAQISESAPIDASQALKVLCDLLHEYLGPVAPLICEDITQGGATMRTAADLDAAIVQLASEIESGAEAREFIQRAREQLINR